jgi:lysophospholipase L1-like esterase
VQLVTIFLGANDAVLPTHNPHQHVPLDAYAANLRAMLATCAAEAPGARVLLLTPPPIEDEGYARAWANKAKATITGVVGLDRSYALSRRYRAAAFAVAREPAPVGVQLGVLDTWGAFLADAEAEVPSWLAAPGALFSDGLHLGAEGNARLAAAMLARIAELWPELAPGRLASRVPWHDQFQRTEVPGALFRHAHPGGLPPRPLAAARHLDEL